MKALRSSADLASGISLAHSLGCHLPEVAFGPLLKLMTYDTTLHNGINSRIYHFYAADVYCRNKTPVKILKLSGNAGGTTLSLVYQ